jgi:hypothetical protein
MTVTNARPKQVNVRLSEAEHADIAQKAEAAGVTLSEFVRLAALGRQMPVRGIDSKRVVSAISHVGGLLNQLARSANRGRFPVEADITTALADLRAVIRAIGSL